MAWYDKLNPIDILKDVLEDLLGGILGDLLEDLYEFTVKLHETLYDWMMESTEAVFKVIGIEDEYVTGVSSQNVPLFDQENSYTEVEDWVLKSVLTDFPLSPQLMILRTEATFFRTSFAALRLSQKPWDTDHPNTTYIHGTPILEVRRLTGKKKRFISVATNNGIIEPYPVVPLLRTEETTKNWIALDANGEAADTLESISVTSMLRKFGIKFKDVSESLKEDSEDQGGDHYRALKHMFVISGCTTAPEIEVPTEVGSKLVPRHPAQNAYLFEFFDSMRDYLNLPDEDLNDLFPVKEVFIGIADGSTPPSRRGGSGGSGGTNPPYYPFFYGFVFANDEVIYIRKEKIYDIDGKDISMEQAYLFLGIDPTATRTTIPAEDDARITYDTGRKTTGGRGAGRKIYATGYIDDREKYDIDYSTYAVPSDAQNAIVAQLVKLHHQAVVITEGKFVYTCQMQGMGRTVLNYDGPRALDIQRNILNNTRNNDDGSTASKAAIKKAEEDLLELFIYQREGYSYSLSDPDDKDNLMVLKKIDAKEKTETTLTIKNFFTSNYITIRKGGRNYKDLAISYPGGTMDTVPICQEPLKKLNAWNRQAMYERSLYLSVYAGDVTKIRYYQTEKFGLLIQIVVIIVMVVLYIYGQVSIGQLLWSLTLALFLPKIVGYLLEHYYETGNEAYAVVAAALVIVASIYNPGAGFQLNAVTITNAVSATMNLAAQYNNYVVEQMTEEYLEDKAETDKAMDFVEAEYDKLFENKNLGLNHLVLEIALVESPEGFFARVDMDTTDVLTDLDSQLELDYVA